MAACVGLAASLGAGPAVDNNFEPIRCGDLIVWNTGRDVHAVRFADGSQPWKDSRDGKDPSPVTDSLLFPRGVAAARLRTGATKNLPPLAAPSPLAACSSAARAIAILDGISATDDDDDAAALVCLDLSAAAEGRLAWIAPPPAVTHDGGPPRPTVFDGAPAADAARVYCVVRSREPADWLHLAAYDLRDGHVIWTRPLGSAIAADGIDHAPRKRSARLDDGLVTIDTRAGNVAVFSHDGRQLNAMPSQINATPTGARP